MENVSKEKNDSCSQKSCDYNILQWTDRQNRVQFVLKSVCTARQLISVMIYGLTTASCVDGYPAVACCLLDQLFHCTGWMQTQIYWKHMNNLIEGSYHTCFYASTPATAEARGILFLACLSVYTSVRPVLMNGSLNLAQTPTWTRRRTEYIFVINGHCDLPKHVKTWP